MSERANWCTCATSHPQLDEDGHVEYEDNGLAYCSYCTKPIATTPASVMPRGNIFFVNVYEEDMCYGGPEEGGWWFSTGTAVRSHPVPQRRLAERLQETLQSRYDANAKHLPKVSSVIYHGGRHRVVIEHHVAEDYPRVRPHYE